MLNLQTQTTIPDPLVGFAILYWATTFEWRVKKNIAGTITDESLLEALGDYYTSTEIDAILLDYYTSAEVDTIFTGYYTAIQVDNLLDDKEDAGVAAALIAALTKVDVGLDQVDNTSDADKPISDATQAELDLKEDTIVASNLQFIYQNASGIREGAPGYFVSSEGGLQFGHTVEPDDLTGYHSFHNLNLNITPLQDSPDDTYSLLNLNVNSSSAAFNYGTNGRAVTVQNLNISHTSNKDIGEINFLNNYFNLGNGTDAIDVRGFSYAYGFGNVNANVNISNAMQGYGFQPSFHASATVSSGTYLNAFYDALNAPGTAFPSYISYSSNPSLGSIINNSNFTGALYNPTIPVFTGNAGANLIAIAGNFGTFDSGGLQCININPNVTSGNYVAGININMSNATGTNVKAIDVVGDVNINGGLAFTGGLSIGALNAFGVLSPVVDGGGNPTSIHTLITQIDIPANATTANADTISTNTAALISVGANSAITLGGLGVFAALGLPAVVETHTGSVLPALQGALFAINLAGSSTGGTINQLVGGAFLAIPNGVTSVPRWYGAHSYLPFGLVATDNWGVYSEDCEKNYFEGAVKIGGTDLPNSGLKLHVDGDSMFDGDIGFYNTTPVAQQPSSGAVSAGGTYTATEQTMIQEMYDALRAYGLLT